MTGWQYAHPWGMRLSRGMVIWPGDLLCFPGWGGNLCGGFPRRCRVRAVAWPWVKLERPQR
jgi:hypothetical protein